jgi:iron-sulfur cluster assembly protein
VTPGLVVLCGRRGVLLAAGDSRLLWYLRLQREGMDRTTDLIAEHAVDKLVLLDAVAPSECWREDCRAEMVAAAGVVLHLGLGTWYRGLDALLDLLCGGHATQLSQENDVAILWKAMISITDKGAEKVREFLDAQQADVTLAGLRVGVRGGGCSGFQYQLAFDEQRENDIVFEDHGLKLLVDNESLQFVSGSVIDYQESLQGAGFKVENPNVVAACGCGSSFRVAEEEQVSAV